MSTNPTSVQAEVADLRDALDHIMRTARASRSQTKRLHWISERARMALEGGDWRDMPAPPRVGTISSQISYFKRQISFLEEKQREQLAADIDHNHEGSTLD